MSGKKTARNQGDPRKGEAGFDSHYSQIYGERWAGLLEAMRSPVRQVARINRFVERAEVERRFSDREIFAMGGREVFARRDPLDRIDPHLVPISQTFKSADCSSGSASSKRDSRNDLYVMDPASIFPAAALADRFADLTPSGSLEVLDLCAAPGGKSLILAESLPAGGRLTCNEMSDRRRARLRAVLEDYLPSEVLQSVKVTGHDGARWCLHETEVFDAVLVDAPCSGERHLLDDPEELGNWSPARSKNLAVRQYSLVASAHAVLKTGGIMAYSTCSISPSENDGVIARLLKKRAGEVRVLPIDVEIGEATEHGRMILPDQSGYGPIYWAVLQKISVD